jgi:hypothetical protein
VGARDALGTARKVGVEGGRGEGKLSGWGG